MKLILTAGTLLLFCPYFFNEVHACTCLDYGAPTCSLFARADAVFVGKIERITSAMGDNDASVQLGEGLREGTYTIVMNDDDFLDGSSPFPRHYYPGVRDFSKAEPIVLEQGEEKTQIRFKALPMIPLRAVSGQVFRKDGNPFSAPAGQKLYIKVHNYEKGKEPKFFFIHSYRVDWGEGKDGSEIEMVDVSPDGKISLSLFEGSSYIVSVETNPWGDKVECGMAKVDISSQPANQLRIVIDRKGRCDEKAFAKELDAGIKK